MSGESLKFPPVLLHGNENETTAYFGEYMIKHLMLVTMLLALLSVSAFAQLTDKDIVELQQQSQDEEWTFTVSRNGATDYSLDELCGLVEPDGWRDDAVFDPCTASRLLPEYFDWRDHNGLPPVRNQGGCGSCWAFATVGALECNIHIQDGQTVDLSEQYLVSCNRSGWGCGGGWFAHEYHIDSKDVCDSTGAVMEESFPYTATDEDCGCPYQHPYRISSWAYIGSPSVSSIKQAILDYGPITVTVTVTSAFHGYDGGIFNNCSWNSVNHAVVLVGWDDNQGSDGIWFMRNSWGPYWGEDGYMRIEYNCSRIGQTACYVDYRGGAVLNADVHAGIAPLEVNFTGSSGLDVDSWSWSFGDGNYSDGQNATYVYNQRGLYNVTLMIVAGEDFRYRIENNYIAVLADTIIGDSIQATSGSSTEVEVYGTNTVPLSKIIIPVEYSGSLDIQYDSFSTAGCRTENFGSQQKLYESTENKTVTIQLEGDGEEGTMDYLPAGDGPIVKLYFSLEQTALRGETTSIIFDGYDTHETQFVADLATYEPVLQSGLITYNGCCVGIRGNIDSIGGIDVTDLVYLVNFMFKDGPAPPCFEEADVNGSGGVLDVSDLVYLVNYMFKEGIDPESCP